MLAPVRIEVERRRIRYVTTYVIGYDGNVIAYLVLLRPAFSGIE